MPWVLARISRTLSDLDTTFKGEVLQSLSLVCALSVRPWRDCRTWLCKVTSEMSHAVSDGWKVVQRVRIETQQSGPEFVHATSLMDAGCRGQYHDKTRKRGKEWFSLRLPDPVS